MWPTPRASDGEKGGPNQRGSKGDLTLPSAVRKWPTPTVRDYRSASTEGIKREGGALLPEAVGGLLNPTWVEWLLGVPTGWTAFDCSATEWSRWQRLSHSIFSLLRQ